MDFGNGLQYDPKTGKVIINDESGKQVYQYDPTAPGGGKTFYNGQSYTGRYNPLAIGAITDEQLQGAYGDYLPNAQQKQTDYYKTHGLDTTGVNDKSQPILDQLAFNKAASEATKKLSPEDQSFFDTLKSMAAKKQSAPSEPQVPLQTPTQPTVKPLPAITPQTNVAAMQPFFKQPDVKATEGPNNPQQPDYTGFLQALYQQIQPSLAQLSTPPASTPKSLGNTTSPSFSLGGYNPQESKNTPQNLPTGPSGKGTPSTETQQPSGMATGQFGSK